MEQWELDIKNMIMSADDLNGTIELHIGPFSNNLPQKTIYESQIFNYRYVYKCNYELMYDENNICVGDRMISTEEYIEKII